MTAAWEVAVLATCVWAAVVGTLIGRDIFLWFWRTDDEEER